jgi:hypothetical protein
MSLLERWSAAVYTQPIEVPLHTKFGVAVHSHVTINRSQPVLDRNDFSTPDLDRLINQISPTDLEGRVGSVGLLPTLMTHVSEISPGVLIR